MGMPDLMRWLEKRTPEVRARVLRLNQLPIDEGRFIRGYRPHRRSTNHWTGLVGKRDFIRENGAEAWAALPRCCIIHDGHRKAVTRETVLDQVWKLPTDHPVRQAKRDKGKWIIQAR